MRLPVTYTKAVLSQGNRAIPCTCNSSVLLCHPVAKTLD